MKRDWFDDLIVIFMLAVAALLWFGCETDCPNTAGQYVHCEEIK